MKSLFLVTFALRGGATQKMILDKDQKLFVNDLAHDIQADSYNIERL